MRLGYPVVSRHVSMGTRTLAGHRRLRAERSTSAFCSIWLRIGNSMGREVFKRVRRESPAAYLKVCAMLVPREMQVEHSGGVKAMTDEQLERGIELIKEMLAPAGGARRPGLSGGWRSRWRRCLLHRVRQGARCEGATEPTVALRLGLWKRSLMRDVHFGQFFGRGGGGP